MLYASTKFITNHSFAVPFFIGAVMCSLWGGVINLMLFIGLVYLICKFLGLVTKPNNPTTGV